MDTHDGLETAVTAAHWPIEILFRSYDGRSLVPTLHIWSDDPRLTELTARIAVNCDVVCEIRSVDWSDVDALTDDDGENVVGPDGNDVLDIPAIDDELLVNTRAYIASNV